MNSSKETAIKISDMSFSYAVQKGGATSFKELLFRFGKNAFYYQKQVLHQINLEVCKGEVFGLIGRNGSGKSTLLRLISKVLYPTEGKVEVFGQVAPLLSLGVGLQPELSGIDNIKICSVLLGRGRKEIKQTIEEVASFSELSMEDLSMQVKRYSSGMKSRLSFSIATAKLPKILIIDEVLSVGDVKFKEKCYQKIKEIKEAGTTILFVSHGLQDMKRLCDRAALIEKGRIVQVGDTSSVIDTYKEHNKNIQFNK